jgi:hypothetical protein
MRSSRSPLFKFLLSSVPTRTLAAVMGRVSDTFGSSTLLRRPVYPSIRMDRDEEETSDIPWQILRHEH